MAERYTYRVPRPQPSELSIKLRPSSIDPVLSDSASEILHSEHSPSSRATAPAATSEARSRSSSGRAAASTARGRSGSRCSTSGIVGV